MPACLATSSRLMFAPDRVKESFAISRMRSRLRCASARGLRGTALENFEAIRNLLQPEAPSAYQMIRRLSPLQPPSTQRSMRVYLPRNVHKEKRMANEFGATSTTEDVLSGIDLQGKRILVTGVSAGLGVETARSLAAHGAHVVGAA